MYNTTMKYNFFDVMSRAQRVYSQMTEPICRKWELTRNELDVMLFLANNPEMDRAADIVAKRGLSKSHVSMSIASLEKRGLLVRREDEKDRRTVHLALTEEANTVIADGRATQLRFLDCLHQGVSQEQIQMMMDFVDQVSENVLRAEKEI